MRSPSSSARLRPVFVAVAAMVASCGGGGDTAADCVKAVIEELPLDTINPRGVVGLTDGTAYQINASRGELVKLQVDGVRITAAVDRETVGAIDYLGDRLWVSFGRPANRLEVYAPDTLQLLDTVDISIGQPVGVLPAGRHVVVRVAEGGAEILDASLSPVGVIENNGPAVSIGTEEYAILDGVLVRVGCRTGS